jgi:hypothetical protein
MDIKKVFIVIGKKLTLIVINVEKRINMNKKEALLASFYTYSC